MNNQPSVPYYRLTWTHSGGEDIYEEVYPATPDGLRDAQAKIYELELLDHSIECTFELVTLIYVTNHEPLDTDIPPTTLNNYDLGWQLKPCDCWYAKNPNVGHPSGFRCDKCYCTGIIQPTNAEVWKQVYNRRY